MSTKTRHTITTFQGGELSEEVKGRTDIEQYAQGLDTLENMIVNTHGSLSRRAGTEFVFTQAAGNIVRHFGYNYAGGVANGGITFLMSVKDLLLIGASLSPVASGTIVLPYTAAQIPSLQWVQVGDVLFIVHPSHVPAKLWWDATTSAFVYKKLNDRLGAPLTDSLMASGPFLPENISGTSIQANAGTAPVTLTASASLFVAAHVGSVFKLSSSDGFLIEPDWQPSTSYTNGDQVKWNGNVYEKSPGGVSTSGTIPPTHTSGTASDGSAFTLWTWIHAGSASVLIETFISTTQVSGRIISPTIGGLSLGMPASIVTKPTLFWNEGAWSDVRGWPRAISRHEQRLVLAGTSNNPQTVWGSAVDAFLTFKGGSSDSDSFEYTLAEEENSYISWIKSVKAIVVGTTSGLFSMSGSAANSAITPTNVSVLKRSHYGAADVLPALVGENLIFVTTDLRLRQFTFRFETDSFTSDDLTLLSGDILSAGVVDVVSIRDKGTTIWVSLADGTLASCTFDSELKITAWQRHILGFGVGSVSLKSIASLQGLARDELWLALDRVVEVSGPTFSYSEKLHSPILSTESVEDSFYLDWGTHYNGAPTTTITAPIGYRDATVSVIADGKIHPDKVISATDILTLDYAASKVTYGLKYTSKVRTLPLETGEASVGKSKRLTDIALRVVQTGAGAEIGGDFTDMDPLLTQKVAVPMNAAVPLFNGLLYPSFPGHSTDSKEVQLALRQSTGLPLNVSAVSANVRVG